MMSRGVVLEIYFDKEQKPAVMCPLADFFGNGCIGRSEHYSSLYLEFAPQTYNCYFPMPFKEHARVVLKNETDNSFSSYSFVEWEMLDKWLPDMGYFHATFKRQIFQLTKKSNVTFFEVKGKGHIVGRQMSFATDEPLIKTGGTYWGEGNNEIDIDSTERAMEYLGFEDAFGFSWGYQNVFKGLRQGITFVTESEGGDPIKFLSVYRWHDQKPIRFNKHLKWRVNWQYDNRGHVEFWDKAVADGGFWVDFATVHYWYQDSPAGYEHELPPIDIRNADLLHSSIKSKQGTPVKLDKGNKTPEVLVPGGEDFDTWMKKQK